MGEGVQVTTAKGRFRVYGWRLLILGVVLSAWEYLPEVPNVRHYVPWLDPFFISSPSGVYGELSAMAREASGRPSLWSHLGVTVEATLIGTGIGIGVGIFAGAFLSNNAKIADVLSIYIQAANAVPRVALIPIIVIIAGVGIASSVIACAIVVSFLVFFNAFEGGRSVPIPMLQNVRLLRATEWQIMFRVRFRYVLMWTFAALPNAVAFGLVVVVTTELLTGTAGMGGLMETATANANAPLAFAVMVSLACVGLMLIMVAERIKRSLLHWQ